MKKAPLVSVIVPTKNEEQNIVRCLKSIQKQTYETIEILLVDNFSTDKTLEVSKKFVTKQFKCGDERSQQRNFGAQKAKGQWLLFIDADMELSKDVIEECVRRTQKQIVSPIITITEKGVGTTFWGKALALEKNCYRYTFWLQAARFFPRKYFLDLNGYDKTLVAGEDWDITQRFRDAGLPNISTKYSYITHYEPKISLFRLLKKEIFYITHIDKYAAKHPLSFSYQGSLLYRMFLWTRCWKVLLGNPILTSSFIFYKFLVWIIWQFYKKKHKNNYW